MTLGWSTLFRPGDKQPNKIPENQKVVQTFNTTFIYLCLGSWTMVPHRYAPDITNNRCEIKYLSSYFSKKGEMIMSTPFVHTIKYTQHKHYRNQAITIIQKCTKWFRYLLQISTYIYYYRRLRYLWYFIKNCIYFLTVYTSFLCA